MNSYGSKQRARILYVTQAGLIAALYTVLTCAVGAFGLANGAIQLVINSPAGKESSMDDSYLRKAAIKAKVPYMTTVAAAKATADGIHYLKKHGGSEVKSLQELHSEIHDA